MTLEHRVDKLEDQLGAEEEKPYPVHFHEADTDTRVTCEKCAAMTPEEYEAYQHPPQRSGARRGRIEVVEIVRPKPAADRGEPHNG